MSLRFSSEVKSYMEKAEQAVAAAEKLILDGYYTGFCSKNKINSKANLKMFSKHSPERRLF